jgi:hypothetical protein
MPSHEIARKRPMTVATEAIGGQSRSQRIVQRARLSARVSTSLRSAWSGTFRVDPAALGDCFANEFSEQVAAD